MDRLRRTSNTGSIPLHRVAVVRPFAEFLTGIGTPVEQGFRQAGLPGSPIVRLRTLTTMFPRTASGSFLSIWRARKVSWTWVFVSGSGMVPTALTPA